MYVIWMTDICLVEIDDLINELFKRVPFAVVSFAYFEEGHPDQLFLRGRGKVQRSKHIELLSENLEEIFESIEDKLDDDGEPIDGEDDEEDPPEEI